MQRWRLAAIACLTIGAGSAVADAAPPGAATEEIPIAPEAREQFRIGVGFLEDPAGPRWEEAYRAFRAAFEISPSPKILGNLGVSAMMLERDGEAIEAFSRYLAEVEDISPEEREQYAKDLAQLRASVVTVELTVTPEGASIVDERVPVQSAPIVNRYGPAEDRITLSLRPGQHRITAEVDGRRASWDVSLEPASRHAHAFDLNPPPPPPPALPPPDWFPTSGVVSLALTGAVGIAAAVTSGIAASHHADWSDAHDAGDTATADDLRGSGEDLNLVADVLLIGTGVGAIITTILFVFPPEAPDVTVDVGSSRAALSVRGRF